MGPLAQSPPSLGQAFLVLSDSAQALPSHLQLCQEPPPLVSLLTAVTVGP